MSLENKFINKKRERRLSYVMLGSAAALGAAVLLQSAVPGHALPVTNQPPAPEPEPQPDPTPKEICDDGIDNDNDGYIDKDDPDCIPTQPPPEQPKPWYYFLQQMPKVYIAYNKVSSHAMLFIPIAATLYGGLYLASRKFPKARQYSSFISLGITSAISTASELIQSYTAGRHGTLDDMGLNIWVANIPVLLGTAMQGAPYFYRYVKGKLKH